MATFKAEVYAHQKKQDNTYNIKVRVTHGQRKKYLSTTYYVTREDLTRKLKIKNQYYIDETDKLIRKYRKICDRVGERLKMMTVEQVVELITGNDSDENFDLDIVAYGRAYAKQLRDTGHVGNAKTYEVSMNNLVKFVGRESVSVREITVKFLDSYIKWIREQPAPSKKVKGERAPSLYLSNLRAVYNRAKSEFNDEDLGVIRIPLSPFQKIKLPQIPLSRKRALDVEQIRKIAELEYIPVMQPGKNRFNLAKDVFLLSFALVGMNAVDLYNCDLCKNGRIIYQRTKTKNRRADKAEISIRIEPEIQALIDKYRDPDGKRMFGFYHWYASKDTFSSALNHGLKKTGEMIGADDLEFYAARHSWATIAANEAEVDKYTVHLSLNHVDETMKVTDRYIKKSWDVIDRANRKVLDHVNLQISRVLLQQS
jgi:integrase